MTEIKLKEEYECEDGGQGVVRHCLEALTSLDQALKKVSHKGKRKSSKVALEIQIKRLASGRPISGGSKLVKEGDLPVIVGHAKSKFYALKRIPIRAYFWYSKSNPDYRFISHYIYKSSDKLKNEDITRVGDNWIRVEVNGDEN